MEGLHLLLLLRALLTFAQLIQDQQSLHRTQHLQRWMLQQVTPGFLPEAAPSDHSAPQNTRRTALCRTLLNRSCRPKNWVGARDNLQSRVLQASPRGCHRPKGHSDPSAPCSFLPSKLKREQRGHCDSRRESGHFSGEETERGRLGKKKRSHSNRSRKQIKDCGKDIGLLWH